MEITDSFLTLLQNFAPVFTAPTYQTFVVIVTGWIISQRHRYVTEVIFSSGRVGDGHWSRFHRFFSHAAWDIDTFSMRLAKLVVTILAPYAQLKGSWSCTKNGKPLFHHVLQCVSCWKKELPDGDCRQGRRDYTKCPGTRSRGTWAGDRCYPTASKVHRRQLVADARPDSAQKTGCQGHRFPIHRCTVGPRRHFDGRRESLHASTRGVPPCGAGAHRAPGIGRVASNRRPAEQVHERSHRRQQYHRTARRTGRPVPRLWRHLARGAGRDEDPPAVGLPHRLDPPTANHPRARQRRYQPDRPGGRPGRVAVAVRPGLLLSGSVPEPHAGRCFLDLSAAAWHVGLRRPGPALGAVAIPAAADRVGTDRRVGPAGREPSPALPIDRSAGAPRGGRPEATESLREGPEAWPRAVAGVSRMAGLDDLRDQLRAGVADVGGRRRALPRAVADRTYVQTLEIAQPARDTPRRRDRGGAVGGGLRQVDHRACATLDPPDRDLVRVPPQPDEGRSDHRRLGYVADRRLGRPRPTHCGLESHEGRPP